MTDFSKMDDAALDALRVEVLTEQSRRQAIAQAPGKLADLVQQVYSATTKPEPTAGKAPTDWPAYVPAKDALTTTPYGAVVEHKGRLYRAARGDNAPSQHSPTDAPVEWQDVTFELLPDLRPPAVAAWSASAAYAVGDRCTRNGRLYECIVGHGPEYAGTWGPPAAGVWKDIGPA